MYNEFPKLSLLLNILEFFSACTGIIYIGRNKNSYWKWFALYLILTFINDTLLIRLLPYFNIKKQHFYAYWGLPIQFIFLYWLYALKSLKSKELFVIFSSIYVLSFIPIELYFEKLKVIYSFNYIVATLLLMILVFLEFRKQIQNDDILEFKKNKMFYVNFGVMLFYVGTLPFFGLYNLILKDPAIWNYYYLYFLISNCIMYLLFAASFIWGKPKL